jgi:cytochrome c556
MNLKLSICPTLLTAGFVIISLVSAQGYGETKSMGYQNSLNTIEQGAGTQKSVNQSIAFGELRIEARKKEVEAQDVHSKAEQIRDYYRTHSKADQIRAREKAHKDAEQIRTLEKVHKEAGQTRALEKVHKEADQIRAREKVHKDAEQIRDLYRSGALKATPLN